jgi:flagellar M-ring protein FliF
MAMMFDRFRAASAEQQTRWIVAGVVLIGAALVIAWYLFLHITYKPIFTNMRPGDASAIIADLQHKKVPFQLADGGTTILVPADQVDMTRLNVMSGDIPLKGTVGFELFSKSDMGLTDFAQKINYQRALQGELERTIMTLDGVDNARVHLSLGEDRLFRDDRVPPKASVAIRMKEQGVLSDGAALGIRRMVAAAVPNLDVADVVILDEKGGVISTTSAPEVLPQASPLQEEKQAIALFYESHIREALEHGGQARGDVKIVLDPGFRTSGDGRTAWNPAARDFPLQVQITPQDALDAAHQEAIRTLVLAAIAPQNGGDQVSFGEVARDIPDVPAARDMPAHAPHDVAKPAPLMISSGSDDGNDMPLEIGSVLLLATVFVFGLYLLLRRLGSARRVSAQERENLVARLRKALDGGAHAAP